MRVGVRGGDLPWSPLVASIAIHAVFLALIAAPDAGRRAPVATIPTSITASLAGDRVAREGAASPIAASRVATSPSAGSDAQPPKRVSSPVRAEAAVVRPESRERTTESSPSLPATDRSAQPAMAPDDDIADVGRYRMVFAFAMRRAVTADLPAASQRVRVLLALVFDDAGGLAVEVRRSSGDAAVDAQAVGIVRAAHAAAPVPARLRGTPLRFEVTVELAQPGPAVVAG